MEEGVDLMTNAVTSITSIAGDVLTMITGNETLMVFFCAGLVFTAIGVVKALKRQVKGKVERLAKGQPLYHFSE